MQNQAVIDIEDYYKMRRENETLKVEMKALRDTSNAEIKMLKVGLILLANPVSSIETPKFRITSKEKTLVITVEPNVVVTDRFNDVEVTRRPL